MDHESEVAAVKTLRSRLESTGLTEAEERFLTDKCIRRYLRARDGNVDKAEEMIRESLQWRKEWNPEAITYEMVKQDYEMGKMYIGGKDKQGRPIVIVRPARDVDDHGDIDTKVRFYVYTLEQAIRQMNEAESDIEQMVWIVDMNGYSVGPADLKRVSLVNALLTTLQNQYPERVARLVLVSPPWYFRFLFALVKPILSQKTLDKISMDAGETTKSSGAQLRYPQLEELIDLEELEVAFGGKRQPPAFTGLKAT